MRVASAPLSASDVDASSTRLMSWHSPLVTLPTTVWATASSSAALEACSTAACAGLDIRAWYVAARDGARLGWSRC